MQTLHDKLLERLKNNKAYVLFALIASGLIYLANFYGVWKNLITPEVEGKGQTIHTTTTTNIAENQEINNGLKIGSITLSTPINSQDRSNAPINGALQYRNSTILFPIPTNTVKPGTSNNSGINAPKTHIDGDTSSAPNSWAAVSSTVSDIVRKSNLLPSAATEPSSPTEYPTERFPASFNPKLNDNDLVPGRPVNARPLPEIYYQVDTGTEVYSTLPLQKQVVAVSKATESVIYILSLADALPVDEYPIIVVSCFNRTLLETTLIVSDIGDTKSKMYKFSLRDGALRQFGARTGWTGGGRISSLLCIPDKK